MFQICRHSAPSVSAADRFHPDTEPSSLQYASEDLFLQSPSAYPHGTDNLKSHRTRKAANHFH